MTVESRQHEDAESYVALTGRHPAVGGVVGAEVLV